MGILCSMGWWGQLCSNVAKRGKYFEFLLVAVTRTDADIFLGKSISIIFCLKKVITRFLSFFIIEMCSFPVRAQSQNSKSTKTYKKNTNTFIRYGTDDVII